MTSATAQLPGLEDMPEYTPPGDYRLRIQDYIRAGEQGGAQNWDTIVLEHTDPKLADKHPMPIRMRVNEQPREKPASLDDDTWASIQEGNRARDEYIFGAFGWEPDNLPPFDKMLGKDTGKDTLRVGYDREGANTILMPRNPAPQGEYHYEIRAVQEKTYERDYGTLEAINLTLGFVGEGYSPIKGLDTYVPIRWTRACKLKSESEDGSGWESAQAYLARAVQQQGLNKAKSMCAAFGLPMPELKQDDTTFYLEFPTPLSTGLKTKNKLRTKQSFSQFLGDTTNTVQWPPAPRG